jgi:hypothetical protein
VQVPVVGTDQMYLHDLLELQTLHNFKCYASRR